MELLTINGTVLPTPSEYEGITSDLVDSGRNANGVVVSNVIRQNIGKVTAKWNFLTPEEMSQIASLLKTNFYVTVKYYDYTAADYRTCQMYPNGTRKSGKMVSVGGDIKGFKDVELSLIEV